MSYIRKRLTNEKIQNIVQLGKADKSVLEIEKETGHTRSTIERWLKFYDIELKKRSHKWFSEFDREFIEQHYNNDMSATEIGAVLGHSPATIQFRVNHKGNPPQTRRFIHDEEVRQLHRKGMSNNEIASALGFHTSTVKRSLKRMNLRTNFKDPGNSKGRQGEILAEEFFEENKIKVLEVGTNNSPFDFIVRYNDKTFAINVRHTNRLNLVPNKIEVLEPFGIPVILWLDKGKWFWLEVKQW